MAFGEPLAGLKLLAGFTLLEAIRSIKAEGATDAAQAAVRAASADLLLRGARVQLIACTEFSLIPEPTVTDAIPLDTLDVLVRLIRDFALSDQV